MLVPPRGPEDSPLVIIGEAPGSQEMKERKPFVGPSGEVLKAALEQFPDGSCPEPYVLNVIPKKISRGSGQDEISKLVSQYGQQARDLIAKHPRKVIIALGAAALWCVMEDHSLKITKRRGSLLPCKLASIGCVPAVHPAYLMRSGGSLRQFKSDIAYGVGLCTGERTAEYQLPTWEVISSVHHLNWMFGKIEEHAEHGNGIVGADIETSGFSFLSDKVLCSGFSIDGNHVWVVEGQKKEALLERRMTQLLKGMWNIHPKVRWSWHNGKFDIKFFRALGQHDARVDEDTMLMSYALDETRGIHDLEAVASDWLGSPNWKGILDQYKKKKESYDIIPRDVLYRYMAYDVGNTHRLTNILGPKVQADKYSAKLYNRTLIPASEYLTKIEMAGMESDPEQMDKNEFGGLEDTPWADEPAGFKKQADAASEVVNAISIQTGYGPINCNSPKQLSDFLYRTLGLKRKDGKKLESTDADALDALPNHPAVEALKTYRKINKGLTTYIRPIRDKTDIDGRVHSTYLLHGAATGRLASRDPNLQNIPREPKLRGQFRAAKGKIYIEPDLNQAELRSLACLSGDPELCRIYSDPDSVGLHEVVRAEIFGYATDWSDDQLMQYMRKWYTNSVERVLEEQKMRAKNVNFGIVYGITAHGLSEQIEDSPEEALRMLSSWANKFPVAWKFIDVCRDASLHQKNIVTVFGHRKRFNVITPFNIGEIRNQSANFPHQSTASTITIHAGMRVQDQLKREFDTDIVNTVHDSLLLEAPDDEATVREVARIVTEEMEQVPIDWGLTRIPFKADAKVGYRWGQMTGLNKYYKA